MSTQTKTDPTTGHTPLPWQVGFSFKDKIYTDSRRIADCHDDDPCPSVTTEEEQANAARIVRAVNAHDALVDALDEARAYIDKLHEFLPEGGTGLGEKIDRKIQNALAKAGYETARPTAEEG